MNNIQKKWVPPDFGPEPTSSAKKPKRNPALKSNNEEFIRNPNHKVINFIDILKPQKVEDLAVDTEKIAEVEIWLQRNVITSYPSKFLPILLLSGPAGTGKTATINVLCKKLNIEIVEWKNPSDQKTRLNYTKSHIRKFLDFFVHTKYKSLLSEFGHKTLALVEDFPDCVIHRSKKFVRVLEKCQNGNTPIVFICSDAPNSRLGLSWALFPQAIRDQFQISAIRFYLCATTAVKSLLTRCQEIVLKYPDKFKIPSSDVINAIISSAMGDIRYTINQFQFYSLRGTSDINCIRSR